MLVLQYQVDCVPEYGTNVSPRYTISEYAYLISDLQRERQGPVSFTC